MYQNISEEDSNQYKKYRVTDYSFYVGKIIASPVNTGYFSKGTPIFIHQVDYYATEQMVVVVYPSSHTKELGIYTFSASELDGSCPKYHHSVLRMGSQGTEVRDLQIILTKFGFYFGIIDGFFGPKTNHSVRIFQESRGLLVDGIVGPITWCQLEKI